MPRPKFEKGNKMASKEVKEAAREKRSVTIKKVETPMPPTVPPQTPSIPANPVPVNYFADVPTAPSTPVAAPPIFPPEPEEDEDSAQPVKRWMCTVPGCKEPMFATEEKLRDHMLSAHKRAYRGGGFMPVGATVDRKMPVTLEDGFMGDERLVNPSVDVYKYLRNILDTYGVGDIREGVVDSFAYDNNPSDVKKLKTILLSFGVRPDRVEMIVDRWSKYMKNIGAAVEDVEEEQRKKTAQGNPMKANFEDMTNWGPAEWFNLKMEMQKQAMAFKMYQEIMNSSGLSGGDMSAMGLNAPAGQSQLTSREAEELKAYRERDKLKEALDPVMRTLTNLRADLEETRQKAEQSPKKDSMADLLDLVKQKELLSTLASGGHGKDAEVMRVQMEERIENKRMQMEKEFRELQTKLESEKNMNHQLEMKNIETRMAAQIDNYKTLADVASRDKGQNLEQVINDALRVQETLKKLGGDTETDDDKKMKNIMGAIEGVVQQVSPSIDKFAQGYMDSQKAKLTQPRQMQGAPPGHQMAAPRGGPGMGQMQGPGAQRPPPGGQGRTMARCTQLGCGREFDIDPKSQNAQCPGCFTMYNIGGSAEPASQQNAPPGGDMSIRRENMLRMERHSLEELARGDNIDPDQYPTNESLVDVMMGSAYGSP